MYHRRTLDDLGAPPNAERKPWHRAVRPEWSCVLCVRPWPCAQAKADLVEEYEDDGLSLYFYLAGQLWDAINDAFRHAELEPALLYDRILGWSHLAIRQHRAAKAGMSVVPEKPVA
jgi:hypothetical protein